jgi:hypothetical protein
MAFLISNSINICLSIANRKGLCLRNFLGRTLSNVSLVVQDGEHRQTARLARVGYPLRLLALWCICKLAFQGG